MKTPFLTRLIADIRQEYRRIFTDPGVMVFFFLLPTLYPIVYTLIYNPETVTDTPVAVVDLSHSPESRQLIRMVDATPEIAVAAYAPDMAHARRLMAERECFGILLIPADYATRRALGSQATVEFFADTSRLLRYRGFANALTEVSIAFTDTSASPIPSQAFFVGNPTQGIASFLIPGILIIILQQSLLLGITTLCIGRRQPSPLRDQKICSSVLMSENLSAFISHLSTLLCCLSLYIPLSLFGLQIVPRLFSLPATPPGITLAVIIPMLAVTALIGMALARFMRRREHPFLFIVFTSPIVLFLSGLIWPRYAMSPLWQTISSLIPSTWAIETLLN